MDHILSLNKTDIQVQSGNFSSWMENFERQQDFEAARNENLQKEIRRLRQTAKQISAWSAQAETGKFGVQSSGLKADRGYVGHKAAKNDEAVKAGRGQTETGDRGKIQTS